MSMIGKTISHYKILEKIGSGGMGTVYKTKDTKLDRLVALKFLPPHLSQAEDEKKRFIHEAKAASALDHPNICSIYEIDETDDGRMFIAMACYEGESLKDRISRGPLPVEEVLKIADQIARGLEKVHAKKIVHRDIKPANILITEDGVVKIVDFGLAKLAGQTKLTKTGTTVGTVAYMSPEQTRGDDVDHRADIWALGVILYEMLTGQRPFKGDYDQAVMYSILNEAPESPSAIRKGITVPLEKILFKALDKEPDRRYQTMRDFIRDLESKTPYSKPISTKSSPSRSRKIDFGSEYWTAVVYSLVNEKEKAMLWLERAIEDGYMNYPRLAGKDPFLENIRNEARFQALLDRVKKRWESL